MYFLDTNVVIGIMTRRVPQFVDRFEAELSHGTPLYLSSIVYFELIYGAQKSNFPDKNLARLTDFLRAISDIVAVDADDAADAGDIRATLEKAGIPIGPYDVLIAAQARRRRMAVVTANLREFNRVPGLLVTDWSP